MADEKLNTGPEVQKIEEAPAPAVADPAHGEAPVPEHPPEQAGPAEPGDVVISAEQIDALMAEKRQAARAEVEKAEASVNRRPGLLHRSILPLKARKLKSRAVAVPLSLIKQSAPGRRLKKNPKRPGPARAAPLRLTRRPPTRPSPHNETNCPEVAGKLPKLLFPRMPERIRPQRRPLPRSRV